MFCVRLHRKEKALTFAIANKLQLPTVIQSVSKYVDVNMRQDGEKIKGVNNDAEVQGIREFDQAVRKAIGDNTISISKSLPVNQPARNAGTRETGQAKNSAM